jgi:hypothetical protein
MRGLQLLIDPRRMALSLSPRRSANRCDSGEPSPPRYFSVIGLLGNVMNPELWVPAVTTIAIVAIVAGSSYRLIKLWLQRSGRLSIPEGDQKEIRDGLIQLQQAVDAIAIEVERLSEGQRFTTKLLADSVTGTAPIPAKHGAE